MDGLVGEILVTRRHLTRSKSREMHNGQLYQRGRSVKLADRMGSKCITVQPKGNVEGKIRVVDLTVDELCCCHVCLGSRTTRMVQRADIKRTLKLSNRTLEIPFFSVLLVMRESTVALICRVF